MKKILFVSILMLMFTLFLGSCEKYEETLGEISLPDLYNQAIEDIKSQAGEKAPETERNLEYDSFESIYPGITEITFNQLCVYSSVDEENVAEFVLCEVMNKKDADKVEKILNERAALMAKSENKAVADAWLNNTSVTKDGNYVIMCCLSQEIDIPECFILEKDK